MENKKETFVMFVLECLQPRLTNISGEPQEMRGLGLRFPLGMKTFKAKMFQNLKKENMSTLMKNFYPHKNSLQGLF